MVRCMLLMYVWYYICVTEKRITAPLPHVKNSYGPQDYTCVCLFMSACMHMNMQG